MVLSEDSQRLFHFLLSMKGMTHAEQSQVKDIIEKVRKQIKNDGTFGNLIKKAVSELEEEGLLDNLREDGKKHSDRIFRHYFPDVNKVVDMNKDLKEKIIYETRAYATRPQLQNTISNKVGRTIKIDWFTSQEHLVHKITDLVRKELGLPLLYEIKEEIKEEPLSEGTNEATAGTSQDESRQDDDIREIKEEPLDISKFPECNRVTVAVIEEEEEGLTDTVPMDDRMDEDDGMEIGQINANYEEGINEEQTNIKDEAQGDTQSIAGTEKMSITVTTPKSNSTSSSSTSSPDSPDTQRIEQARKRYRQRISERSSKHKKRSNKHS